MLHLLHVHRPLYPATQNVNCIACLQLCETVSPAVQALDNGQCRQHADTVMCNVWQEVFNFGSLIVLSMGAGSDMLRYVLCFLE